MELKHAKGRTVRLSVPANVAADLGLFRKAITGFAERLGCKPCVSGLDCLFQIQRDFVVDEKLDLRPMIGRLGDADGLSGEVDADGAPAFAPRSKVMVPAPVAGDLRKVLSVVDTIAGRLGCPACCSGFDLFFRQELLHVADSQGTVHGIGG